jgi:hypothetical protein
MIDVIISILLITLLALLFWFIIRNERVYRFRTKIIDITFHLNVESMKNGDYTGHYSLYDKLPSYEKMMWSLKPLKPKYWLNEEDYLKIIKYL